MLSLEWKPIGKLGRFIINKETKELDSKKIILNEKFVDALSKKVEIFNNIAEQIEKEGYPKFNYSSAKTTPNYPLWHLAKNIDSGIGEIPLDKIVEFSNGHPFSKTQDYPWNILIRDTLINYLGLNPKLEDTSINVEPIKAYKIFDSYLVDKGDYRVFVKKLIGDNLIKAHIFEVDYISMLRKSILLKYPYGYCIGIRREDDPELYMVHDISDEEKDTYIELMNKYDIKLYIKDYAKSFDKDFID